MQLVETHIINNEHEYYSEIDDLAFKSKNLYNYALYQIRQCYFENKTFLQYNDLYKQIRYLPDYQALPDKVSKGTLRKLYDNYTSFFSSIKDYATNPYKYQGKPRLPKYLPITEGRFALIYEKNALNIRHYKETGAFKLSKTNIAIKSNVKIEDIVQVQITKLNESYKICVVHNKPIVINPNLDYNLYAGIDLGVNNLATLVSNKKDFIPHLYNGRIVKSINQGYNKRISKYKSELPFKNKELEESYYVRKNKETDVETLVLRQEYKSIKIGKEYDKRKRKIDDYLHKVSNHIVNQLVSENIGNLVVGLNPEWKQDINIGKVNNQKFVSIPFKTLINMLSYKCKLKGITFDTNEESYTSKCSFIDNEDVGKHESYLGKREKRGLFKSSSGKLINADVNGAYNILKKYYKKKASVDFKYTVGTIVVSATKVILC